MLRQERRSTCPYDPLARGSTFRLSHGQRDAEVCPSLDLDPSDGYLIRVPGSVVDPAGMEVEMSNRMAVVGRGHEVMSRYAALLLAVLCATAAPGVVSTAAAQARASDAGKWEVPRTPDGHPDLQGNWTNMTLTPFEREEGKGPVFTWSEVEELEQPSEQADGCPATPNPGTVECGRVDNQGDGSLTNEASTERCRSTTRSIGTGARG